LPQAGGAHIALPKKGVRLMADLASLRSRLIDMRADTLRHLAEADVINGGYLTLLAGSSAALEMLDAAERGDAVADRAIVADDGQIRLMLYDGAGAVAAIVLDPVRAVRLAGRLIAAALPKLA